MGSERWRCIVFAWDRGWGILGEFSTVRVLALPPPLTVWLILNFTPFGPKFSPSWPLILLVSTICEVICLSPVALDGSAVTWHNPILSYGRMAELACTGAPSACLQEFFGGLNPAWPPRGHFQIPVGMVVRSGRWQSICHPELNMPQRNILCSSNGLWHTWQ